MIAIKNAVVPPSCYFCPMTNDGLYLCKANNPYKVLEDDCEERRPDWCPLVPVQPHGRLIDADALMLVIQEYIEEYGWETDEHGWHNEKWCAMKEAAMVIDAAPTIIEAEEGET